MIGTPCSAATFATWYTAEAWPRPQAQTSCVVQIDPMPIPTRRPSAPASMRCNAWRRVTTLPHTTSRSGYVAFIH
jgi:hypothetical protein